MKAHELIARLLTRGFFPDHLTPPFNSESLVDAYRPILGYLRPLRPTAKKKTGYYRRAKAVRHSVPKRRLSRRFLSVPNPLQHVLVSRTIAKNWLALEKFCAKSTISLSTPNVGLERAFEPATSKRSETRERALRSIGKKFLLKADIARFYPSIYTHSIPWALHGKDAARSDRDLYGNHIDERVRESQDKQTGGIPIGPDTSFVIAEAIGTAVDIALAKQLGDLSGTRYIDDYHLYFDSYNDAEAGLAALHEAAALLELEVNDLKTEITPTPEALEPDWKTELRARTIDSTSTDQQSQIVDLFSRASALALQHPHDNVLTFAAKMVEGIDIGVRNWPLCEALLLRSAVAEPKILRVVLEIYAAQPTLARDLKRVERAISAICIEHGRLQHGNEVLWALWTARTLDIQLGWEIGQIVSSIDDDLVALTALHLEEEGRIVGLDKTFWTESMSGESLYSQHWLLAYEANIKGWLTPLNGNDYIGADSFFTILRAHDVSFYNVEAMEEEGESDYSDDSVGDGDFEWDSEDDDDNPIESEATPADSGESLI